MSLTPGGLLLQEEEGMGVLIPLFMQTEAESRVVLSCSCCCGYPRFRTTATGACVVVAEADANVHTYLSICVLCTCSAGVKQAGVGALTHIGQAPFSHLSPRRVASGEQG